MKKENNQIIFDYDSKELFNEVGILSAYMAKSLSAESVAIDDFSISDDEKEVFDVCVNQTLPNIYEMLIKITPSESSEFINDGTTISFAVKDNNDYNDNILTLVSDTIKECLKYGILSEFYSININMALQKVAQDKFASNLLLLNQRLFQLKRKGITPQFV